MIGGRSLALLAFGVGAGVLGALSACDAFQGETGVESPDAGVPAEAGPDAGGSPFACPVSSLLCDTFERTSVQGLWSFRFGPEARLALDDQVSSSPTRSLRATPNGPNGSVLGLDVSTPALTAIEVTFSLRTDSAEEDFSQVLQVELEPEKGFAIVEIRGGVLALVEQVTLEAGVFYDTRPAAALPIGGFERFRLRVDIGNGTFSLASSSGTTERTFIHGHSRVSAVLAGASFAGSRTAPHWLDDVVITKL